MLFNWTKCRHLVKAASLSRSFHSSLLRGSGGSGSGPAEPRRWSYACGPGDRPLVNMTIGQMVDRSSELFSERTAVICTHEKDLRKTFAEVRADVDRLAAGFVALGLQKGDRIGIWGPNSYQWYLTQLAAGKAGLVLVNINPAYQPSELKYCLNKVGVRALVSAETFKRQNYVEMLRAAMPEVATAKQGNIASKEVPSLQMIITILEEQHQGCFRFKDVHHSIAGSGDLNKLESLQEIIQADDPFNIQFTSGTTGNPKGAVLTHHNIVNNGMFVGYRMGYDKKIHRACLLVPLYHCFGNVVGATALWFHGGSSVFVSHGYSAEAAVDAIEKEECTALYGTPTMFIDMLEVQARKGLRLAALETGIMTGSPCPEELCKKVIQNMHMSKFTVCYGLTETSPVSFQHFPSDSEELKVSTIGFPHDHVEAKVVDAEGKIVPVGTPGELWTRGYSTMLGYWGDEAKTKEAISADRWFHTGDQAMMHPNGYAQIVGRIKDMIIRGGENIYPREIEELLHTHPDILEVQVIGIPDERLGEELCAWIKAKEGTTEEQVKAFCKGKIAHFKIPKHILFVSEFPVTISGKIQKFKMREESIARLGLKKN